MRDKLIRRYKKYSNKLKEAKLKYEGHQQEYNFYGGEEYGRLCGIVYALEIILDEIGVDVDKI